MSPFTYTPAPLLRDNPGQPGSWRVGPPNSNVHVSVGADGLIFYAVAGFPTLRADEPMRYWAASEGEGLL